MDDPYRALCVDSDVALPGAVDGPLTGLRFAVKDLFDIAGHVTGAGNPDWLASHEPARETAWMVRTLLDAGAELVGKTRTDEISRGLLGENAHYGAPINPRAPGRLPGGSSSGSAAAVAGGMADFATGTDTGGSVRVPASFCGLYGIRPSHGRLSFAGVVPQAPSFDTAGWLADDGEVFARVGEVLLGGEIPSAAPTRMIVAEDAFAIADEDVGAALAPAIERLAALAGSVERQALTADGLARWQEHQIALQNKEAWATFEDWLDRANPRLAFDVASNLIAARDLGEELLAAAAATREEARARLDDLLGDDTVICLPSAPCAAPLPGQRRSVLADLRRRVLSLTCIAGLAGTPQVSLPLAAAGGLPVGLSLIAGRGRDELLIGIARAVAAADAERAQDLLD